MHIVRACEINASVMKVVLKEENVSLTVMAFLDALEERLNQANMIGVVHTKLAAFNSMEMDESDSKQSINCLF